MVELLYIMLCGMGQVLKLKYAKNYWYCVSETAHTEHLGN